MPLQGYALPATTAAKPYNTDNRPSVAVGDFLPPADSSTEPAETGPEPAEIQF